MPSNVTTRLSHILFSICMKSRQCRTSKSASTLEDWYLFSSHAKGWRLSLLVFFPIVICNILYTRIHLPTIQQWANIPPLEFSVKGFLILLIRVLTLKKPMMTHIHNLSPMLYPQIIRVVFTDMVLFCSFDTIIRQVCIRWKIIYGLNF